MLLNQFIAATSEEKLDLRDVVVNRTIRILINREFQEVISQLSELDPNHGRFNLQYTQLQTRKHLLSDLLDCLNEMQRSLEEQNYATEI